MRKIKNFRIPVYAHDILRKAKKAGLNLADVNLENLPQLKLYAASLASAANPCTIFETFPVSEYPENIRNRFKGSESATFSAVTIGKGLEIKMASVTDETEKSLVSISAGVFMETAKNLVKDLILAEAEKEGFQLGEAARMEPGKDEILKAFLLKTAEKLTLEKIGVAIGADGKIFPEHTLLLVFPWTAKKRKNVPKR